MRFFFRVLACPLLSCFFPFHTFAQIRDSLSVNALYERLYLLPEDKADSIAFYAGEILAYSQKYGYTRGLAYAERLLGIVSEYKEDTRGAVDHYLRFEALSARLGDTILTASAISDVAGIYAKIQQYPQAKAKYLDYVKMMALTTNRQKLAKGYSNLGVIYRKTNQYDSAIYFYRIGLAIRQELADSAGVATVHNNIASLLLYQDKPLEALPYIEANLRYHRQLNLVEDMWFDYTNLLGSFTLLKNWEKARAYGDTALEIAQKLGSINKQADTYEVLVELAAKKGDYSEAYRYQSLQMDLLKQINNEENNKAIATLQETFNAEKREQENRLLLAQVSNERLQKRNYLLLAAGLLAIASAITYALLSARRAKKRTDEKNALIQKQNQKLAELNGEKNALISMVSHDLSGPLSEIGLWHQVLAGSRATFNTEQQRKAIDRIGQATKNGEQLIRRILDIEKAETNQHVLQLEEVRVGALLVRVAEQYRGQAAKKQVELKLDIDTSIEWLTDQHYFERIAGNLLSNAIKYTPAGKQVWVGLGKESGNLVLSITDEGAGIAAADLPYLFSKYARIGNKPTGGETSTGLGLYIVKRLAEELGAGVDVKSAPGEGSAFRVIFS